MTKDPGPEILSGSTLLQICIGQHQVIMNFDRETSVSVETELTVEPADAGQERWTRPPQAGAALVAFLGRSVGDAYIEENGDLLLSFDQGRVRVRRGRDGYESFQIAAPGISLIY